METTEMSEEVTTESTDEIVTEATVVSMLSEDESGKIVDELYFTYFKPVSEKILALIIHVH